MLGPVVLIMVGIGAGGGKASIFHVPKAISIRRGRFSVAVEMLNLRCAGALAPVRLHKTMSESDRQ